MMADIFPDDWPNDFAEVDCNVLEGVEKSNRVLDPLIQRRDSNSIILTFAVKRARMKVASLRLFRKHNWVLDGRTIRPLPSDISSIIETVIGAMTRPTLPSHKLYPYLDPTKMFCQLRWMRASRPENVDAQNTMESSKSKDCADLFAYQEAGISLMNQVIKNTGGMILADDMGLENGSNYRITPLNGLDPMSALLCVQRVILELARELKICSRSKCSYAQRPQQNRCCIRLKTAQIVIANYDTVVNDISVFKRVDWAWVICDGLNLTESKF